MVNGPGFLRLNRLRVLRRGHVSYDQSFHAGVNIVRGQNGSGKSTIADFIFFILGGEFEEWKEAARRCDEVQAEVETPRGTMTLKRQIMRSQEPMLVYFGPIAAAAEHSLEGWERFPIRRQNERESFSQIMFRSLLVPEAPSGSGANITMHQVLRLCYADQRTPSTRLFRFEPFDTQSIREAVGDLMCGVNGYELYEVTLKLRELNRRHDEIRMTLKTLRSMLPIESSIDSPQLIHEEIVRLKEESEDLKEEIESVDRLLQPGQVKEYLAQRAKAQGALAKQASTLRELEVQVQSLQFELREIRTFMGFLDTLHQKLTLTEATFDAVGPIEFARCPGCGATLDPDTPKNCCIVCKSSLNEETETARYNHIRIDIEIQTRESRQLANRKLVELKNTRRKLGQLRRGYERVLSAFDLEYASRNGPRDAFLAARTIRLGRIDSEVEFVLRSLATAHDISKLESESSVVTGEIQSLTERAEVLRTTADKRRPTSFSLISEIGASILRDDVSRQAEFARAESLTIDFRNDSISVGGLVNFAESSNVILKNSSILSLFLAACEDPKFYHPRFLLIDNVEDKGMEEVRSHRFQETIVARTMELRLPYQVIFTTSMMNPELERGEYTIGPSYTSKLRCLNLG